MLRVALIITLLATLVFTLSQFNAEPVTAPAPESGGDASHNRSELSSGSNITGIFNSAVPAVVPDLYDGYLFTEERKLEEGDLGEFSGNAGESGADAKGILDGVMYSGSVIAGYLRQGLISYTEENLETPRPANPVGRQRWAAAAKRSQAQKSVNNNKRLVVGDRFKGYVVSAIEPDKIVFEKAGEKVEKYLYDPAKERSAGAEASRTPPPARATTTGAIGSVTVGTQVPSPPNPEMTPPNSNVPFPDETVVSPPEPGQATPPVSPRRLRRSQKLLGGNPSAMGLPSIPVPAPRTAPQKNK